MPVDPTDPDTFEDIDDAENGVDLDVEAPEADAAEQHAELAPKSDDPLALLRDLDPAAGSETDLAEQARIVELEDDDYR
ncbi:hypothetical protein GCM10010218_57570 [Streptomyces mashuensis]|uniref:DUF5709 domain-containing protein n=1 Tax=Streptomyces mashuensis TaxID=33904 RepID=A0A919B816_9ACTN|nr:hypothetical protein [Streptomyces mashuensis]GHF68622.1 hypothetical protein GCM10010218_57570 [Streptomyces mashuensis]